MVFILPRLSLKKSGRKVLTFSAEKKEDIIGTMVPYYYPDLPKDNQEPKKYEHVLVLISKVGPEGSYLFLFSGRYFLVKKNEKGTSIDPVKQETKPKQGVLVYVFRGCSK